MEGHNPRPQPGYGGVDQTPSGNLMVGPARTRPRFIWTRQLHNQFTAVVAQLGLRNAKPKNILRLMNVNGLTRRIVASHLQKYRIHLKRCLDGNGDVNDFPRESNFPTYTNSCPCCCRPFGSVGVAMQQHSQETHIPRAPNPWNTGQYGLLSSNSSFIYEQGNSNLCMGIPVHTSVGQPYVQDVEPSANGNGRELKLLDLFPIRDV